MKIIDCGGFTIVLLPEHDLLLILSPKSIEFKCLRCFNLKDVYLFEGKQVHRVPWQETCTCKPNYDTKPLSPDMLPDELQQESQASDLTPFSLPTDMKAVFRFVNREDEA
jgi:hypothetical protein